ncbi:ROK family protein [Clostridium sp. WILCCON 0269]|uniref:ROK family protein n=1 Tax=Candidatus Clostridium eludens TaxID=3381663 RepID=A0ABW8SK40_9CLOT
MKDLKERYVIGVDLGGTKICTALVNFQGKIICKHTLPTKAELGEKHILSSIIEAVEKVIYCGVSGEKIVCMGIGAPGPLDIDKGQIIYTPNLPFKNFDIVTPLKNRFKIPVFLDNDGNAAAMGEYMFGAGKGTENMVFITVSTGIGGGAILNGHIYRGNTKNALEIGHMTLERDGPLCNCGNFGCAEVLASGTAIAREARLAVKKGYNTSLSLYKHITSKEVFKEANLGDSIAEDILNTALNYLGICVANVITCLDPEVVVIGGGVSKAGEIVFEKIKEVVRKRCFKVVSDNTKILPAFLKTDAGVIGAAALVISREERN